MYARGSYRFCTCCYFYVLISLQEALILEFRSNVSTTSACVKIPQGCSVC
ncbi:hypothetical protein IC582_001745 [Cucumis melo]